MEGQNKDLSGFAERVLKVEEEGLKLSITEEGKEGESNVSASCSYLEEKFQDCRKKKEQNLQQTSTCLKDAQRRCSRQLLTAILFGSKFSCLLLRIVLQDVLCEVMKVSPLLKLKIFVDGITAFMEGRNKELVGMAEKILKRS